MFPCQFGKDRAVRERKCPLAICLDRHIVSENGAELIEATGFLRRCDQFPFPISVWDGDAEYRRAFVAHASGSERRRSKDTSRRGSRKPGDRDPFHGGDDPASGGCRLSEIARLTTA